MCASNFFPTERKFCSKTSPQAIWFCLFAVIHLEVVDFRCVTKNSLMDRLSIGNLRNIPALQPKRSERKAGGVSSSSSSLGGSMEPLKICLPLATQLKANQAVTALSDTRPGQVSVNPLHLRERPRSSRQSTGKGDVGPIPSSFTH